MLYVLLDIFVRIQLNMASVQTIAIYMSIYYKGFEQHCEQNVKITSLSTTGKKKPDAIRKIRPAVCNIWFIILDRWYILYNLYIFNKIFYKAA